MRVNFRRGYPDLEDDTFQLLPIFLGRKVSFSHYMEVFLYDNKRLSPILALCEVKIKQNQEDLKFEPALVFRWRWISWRRG